MPYGLQVWDASGVLLLDTFNRLSRQIYTRFLPAGETDSVTVPEWDETKGIAFTQMINPSDFVSAGHRITWSGTTISWTPMSTSAQGDSQLLVFRFK